MKKILMLIISTIFSLSLMCGCNIGPKYYEYGDFICWDRTNEQVYLEGLSKQGKEKEIIIVPHEINSKVVSAISYQLGMGISHGYIESAKLEVMYIQGSPTPMCRGAGVFGGCPNLNKVILLEAWTWLKDDYYALHSDRARHVFCFYPEDKTFVPSFKRNEIKGKNLLFNYANVSYFYNYEGAENEGYYWVDNFTYGTKIEYIPDNPTREDYIFGGWYKEPECVNIWDFEKDTLPESVLNDDGEEIYRETRLYAKWYKKIFKGIHL